MQQKIVRVLRVVLPTAFIAFLVVIGVSYSGRRVDPPPPAEPVTSTIRAENPQSIASEFNDTQTVGGKVFSKIRAKRVMGFASGWYTLEEVELSIFRGGTVYQLVAPQAQFHAASKAAEVKKGVLLKASNGIEIQTEEMKFDGNRLANDIPLTFKAQNWTGKAGGIDLNLELELMHLIKGVEATATSPRPEEPPIHMVSKQAEFLQPKNEVTFRHDVITTRAGDVMKNEAVTAKVDQSHKILTGLEGCCRMEMTLRSNTALLPSDLAQGPTRITSERFHTTLGPQGEIRSVFALGVPALAQFSGPPQRTLRSKEIRIDMEGEQVSRIRADGGVTLQELAATGLRELVSFNQTILMDPVTRRASSAVAEVNVRYSDPKSGATAEQGHYDFLGEILILSSVGNKAPMITTEGHTLRAGTIEVSQKDRVLRARNNVAAQLSQKGGVSASQTAIFPAADGPVFANADTLIMRQNDRVAVFTGNVKAWQGNNVLFAGNLQLEAAGEAMSARDNVRTLLYNIKSGEARKNPIVARSDVMVARRADRKVQLEGNVKIDDEPRTLTAQRATIFLDNARRVERVEAYENIVVVDKATGRRATGSTAVYLLTEKKLNLDGSPATVTDPRGTLSGKQVVFDIAANKVNVVSGDTPTQATYNPQ